MNLLLVRYRSCDFIEVLATGNRTSALALLPDTIVSRRIDTSFCYRDNSDVIWVCVKTERLLISRFVNIDYVNTNQREKVARRNISRTIFVIKIYLSLPRNFGLFSTRSIIFDDNVYPSTFRGGANAIINTKRAPSSVIRHCRRNSGAAAIRTSFSQRLPYSWAPRDVIFRRKLPTFLSSFTSVASLDGVCIHMYTFCSCMYTSLK